MKKVVVIGGGFAGATAARLLEGKFAVTLIDSKDYFEFTPSVLRTLVEPNHIQKIQVMHSSYLQRARVIKDCVTKVTEHSVITEKNRQFPYDYLVICSGSRYHSPIKEKHLVIASRAKELQEYSKQLQEADHVLLIGGGIVGVELAAEIKERFPEKSITIVHAKSVLMERIPKRAQRYAEKYLRAKNITLLSQEKVITFDNHQYITDKGKMINPDLAFLCTGITPNSEFLNGVFPLDSAFLSVNKYLQVEGHSNIFAAGDATNVKEEKTAQAAEKQAIVIVKNILRQEQGQTLISYNSQAKPMVISLGRYRGIFIYKKLILTGIIPGLLKTFIEWKTMRKYR